VNRVETRERLLAFLDTIRRPDVSLSVIDGSDSLVASGLIDSLALLEVVTHLESQYALDFAVIGFDPARLSTISGILDLIEEHAA
jgi:acyl carrier protein